MKKISKILMLLLAVMLVMAIGVTALAADPPTGAETTDPPSGCTISVASGDTHTYEIYQILTGELSKDGTTLSNVTWGSSVNTPTDGKINNTTATDFAKSLEALTGVDAVTEVAKYFTLDSVSGETKKVGIVTDGQPKDGLAVGYYALVDVTALTGDHEKDTLALTILELTNSTAITKKWGTTQDEKTIVADTLGKDDKGSTFDPGTDKDNVSVGDTVNYQITTTIPDNTDKFKEGTFFFVITDKLSSGLTFTEGSIKVYKGSVSDANLLTADKYTVKYPASEAGADEDANTFEIGLINAGAEEYRGATIIVTYSAVLNEDAVIGEAGNPNTSTVQFSNDPNKTYNGSPEDENNKGFPDSEKGVPTGETPKSETKTYTTGIEIQKVDENGNVLTGAAFTIEGESTQIVLVSQETFTKADDGTYYKLTNGTYTTQEPIETPFMKNIGTVGEGSKGYVVDASATGEDTIEMGGIIYRPVNATGDGGKDLYILSESNKDEYEKDTETSKYTKYKKTVEYTQQDTTGGTTSVTASVGPDGVVTFNGLGAGTYTISETTTPDGYNTAPDVTIAIKFTSEPETGKYHWEKDSASDAYVYDADSGVFKTTIVNNKGGKLPETGGIGTTIFYIGGSILVLAALILLVTRRRMSAND